MLPYKKIISAADWSAKDLNKHNDWIYQLSQAELAEINHAVKNCSEKNYSDISQKDFPLPLLSQVIQNKFLAQLENGIGTLLLRGINPAQYSLEELYKLFWGLGLYFGTAVSQSPAGELIHEIKDQGYKIGEAKARGTNTSAALEFHNDPCDVAALFCIQDAINGGESMLVSSVAIHNKMLQDCPELLAELYQPFYFRRHHMDTMQKIEYECRPIFAIEQGFFACNLLRFLIDKAQELPDVPRLTAKQIQALDTFDAIAKDLSMHYKFTMQPGDISFVNNFVVLHGREAFADQEAIERKRLLLRLWLAVPNSRPLPDSYRISYHEIKAGAVRGGWLPSKK
ncbi:MAG: TauD/TfdA family dioxygenase [Gammaproteobacteria bacterium]|jgi:hypothetical protein|nr:TauD/TfdA family dioxygenase [Gammaproteobacteria bacterium]